MVDFREVRAAVKARLDNISGLRASTFWPPQINCPAAIVVPPEGDYHLSMGSPGVSNVKIDVIILAAPVWSTGYERAQDTLDQYLLEEGSFSIKENLELDFTLGGLVSSIIVHGWRDYGVMEVGETPYMGARLMCEVWT